MHFRFIYTVFVVLWLNFILQNSKYASYPDWRTHPHVDRPKLHKLVSTRADNFFYFFCLGVNPGPKFTKKGDDLLPTQVYHPANLHRPASTDAGDIRYEISAEQQATQKQ